MAFNVNEFRSQLEFGGARPTLFEVQIQNPVSNLADLKSSFMIKTATLPASTIGTVQAPYFGRKINLTGDRTFQPWTVTVINDEDFLVRNAMEQWMSFMNSHEGNKEQFADGRPANYKTQATITQFGKDGTKLRIYKFQGLFPSEVSDIQMGWEQADALEEFTVTFTYDWWTVSGGVTGDGATQA